jgi:periplasmic divalent cation tolerance protein
MKPRSIVIYTTFPDRRTAKRIVDGLVREKMAACGNIFRIFSIYRWQGQVERTAEYGAFIKTKRTRYAAVEKYIIEQHPYEVPEIIAWAVDKGSVQYLRWIDQSSSCKMP